MDRHSRLLLVRCVLEPTLCAFKGNAVVSRTVKDSDYVVRLLVSTQVRPILEQYAKPAAVFDFFIEQCCTPLKTPPPSPSDASDSKSSKSAAALSFTRTEDGVMTALATLGQLVRQPHICTVWLSARVMIDRLLLDVLCWCGVVFGECAV